MTIDKEKLKPCPFCGGEVQLETVKSRAGTLYGVVCRNTGNRGGTCAMEQVPTRTAEAAMARWNMRKPEEEVRSKLEVSEDTRQVLRSCLAQAEAEIDALRKDAERYRWLRDKSESVHQFYLSTPIWFTGVKFTPENVDNTIDAAMAKEVQP